MGTARHVITESAVDVFRADGVGQKEKLRAGFSPFFGGSHNEPGNGL